jgi:hypothetical protein
VSFTRRPGTPSWYISAGFASAPGALSPDSSSAALVVSRSDGDASIEMLASSCDIMLIAYILIAEERLRTLLKWYAHHSKIWDFSVSRIFPSEVRSGDEPDD